MNRFICIHGHFYQPPRENPWLEEVELQEPAYPYHDWNQRITAECYAPNAASRIMNEGGRVVDIVNNYWKMSFNFGPTLLSWLEIHEPEVYRAILKADKRSVERFSGHGSAIAQVYNHMIMPLATRRDKHTQIRWGITDFEKRFGRFPEGMWLPETAVDMETLESLVEEGIKFTILSPYQAARVKKIGEDVWREVEGGKIDPKRPYICYLNSGRSINIFFYDKEISQEVAFKGLLNDGRAFAERLVKAFGNDASPQLVNIATDGESYGHHHRFGDMALAYCLHYINSNKIAKITNYGLFLEKFPPEYEVQILDNTSWSCAHGIERWKSDCGCNNGTHQGWNQAWRQPLRAAMDWLRDRLEPLFENEASKYLKDVWKARDDYISIILDRSDKNVEDFVSKHAKRSLSEDEKRSVLRLLEMQRHAMLMYTSCGWFFDDISGIETVQILQYAARALQLAKEGIGVDLESEYLKMLADASSNIPSLGNGAEIFEMFVKPVSVDLLKVGAHYAILSLFEHPGSGVSKVYCYNIRDQIYKTFQSGRLRLAIGVSKISSEIIWDEKLISFVALWLGDHNVFGGARYYMGPEPFSKMSDEISSAFEKGDIQGSIIPLAKHFGGSSHSLTHLFKDDQRRIIDNIFQSSLANIQSRYREIFESNYPILRFLKEINVPLPRALLVAADLAISSEVHKALSSGQVDLESLGRLVDDALRFSVELDKELLALEAASYVTSELQKVVDQPTNVENLERIEQLLRLLSKLELKLDLWRAQNLMFSLAKQNYKSMEERLEKNDEEAFRWLTAFGRLSYRLGIKIPP